MTPSTTSPAPASANLSEATTPNAPINPNEPPSSDTTTETKQMQTHRLHTPAGALSPTHSSFTVTSGVLLWGHILAMHHGSLPNTPFTNDAASAPDPYPEEEGGGGGTILSRTYTYKSAARVGEWKIRRYLSNWREEDGEGEGMEHAGWVICHEDFEAMEVLRRASGISEFGGGASLWNAHDDEGVLYVGRYDWGCGGEEGEFEEEFQKWAEEAIGPVAPQPEGWYTPKSNVMPMGYLAVVDAEEWGLEFLRAYKRDCDDVVVDEEDPPLERVFEKADGERIGAYVRMLAGEHEYAWLIFSGKKHAQFDADELVAIIYDGYSELLEGPSHAVEPDV